VASLKTTIALTLAASLHLGPALAEDPIKSDHKAHAEPKLIWETEGFDSPESVVLDKGAGVLYLSNVNGAPTEANGKGYVSKLSRDGQVLEKEWVRGLNGPKGLGVHDGKLYAADINQVAEIDIKTGKILKIHEAPGGNLGGFVVSVPALSGVSFLGVDPARHARVCVGCRPASLKHRPLVQNHHVRATLTRQKVRGARPDDTSANDHDSGA